MAAAGDDGLVRQDVTSGRDSYVAGKYQAIINFPAGDDHPSTLTSANNLAAVLRALGET